VKVLHVTTLHPARDVRIFGKECRTLAEAGHEVHLAAPLAAAESVDGVSIEPLGFVGVQTGPAGLSRRLRAALAAAKASGAELFHLHEPELLPLALWLKAGGSRVLYDAHEDTPVQVATLGDGGLAGRSLGVGWTAGLAVLGRVVDGVIAATPRVAERFPSAKTVVVRNFPLVEEAEAFAGPPQAQRPRELLYLGGVTVDRGARELVQAIELVPEATIVLAGRVQPPALAQELRHDRIQLAGWLDRPRVAEALRRARAGLLVLQPRRAYVESLPVKMFEYMAAGIPFVASDFSLWRELADGCGLFVDPGDPRAIAAAIERLLDDPDEAKRLGARGRELVRETYNWEHEAERLLALYERLSA
jgi:glycosyltransferase involved in cell wall biosynthesis